jgi:hypothetical protein
VPGAVVRAIEYEIVSGGQIAKIGLPPGEMKRMGHRDQVAVLRCVDGGGQKLTAMGDAGRFR